jgi:hypothetical protein
MAAPRRAVPVELTHSPSPRPQPSEVKEIKTFLEYARRKDARQVTIKKTSVRKAGSTSTTNAFKVCRLFSFSIHFSSSKR